MSKREIEELMRGAHKNPAALAQYAEFQQKQQQKEMQQRNNNEDILLDNNSKIDCNRSSSATDERKKNAIIASKLRWQGRFSQEFVVNYRNNNNNNNNKKTQIVTMSASSQKVRQKINNSKRIPTWILDPKSGKWVRNAENSKPSSDDQANAAENENIEIGNKFPLENPTFFGNNSSWSFSDAEFELVTKRINAERPSLDGYLMDLASTKKLFFFVNRKFGSDFSAVADRWNCEEEENEKSEKSDVSSSFLYRHFCLFVSTLADIRRESLALVLEATADHSIENNKNVIVTTRSTTVLTSIINALFKEHPLLRAAPYFVVDSQDLQNRQEFLDLKAAQISQEDCMGKEFEERMKEIETQASIFQAKCGGFNNNTNHNSNDNNNNISTSSVYSNSMIQNTFAECDKAAAMSLLFAEQRRYFSFVPGSIRSSIDDFIFVDLPATGGSGGGGGGGGGIQQQNIGNSSNQNQNTNFVGNPGGPTTASTTTKSHKDLEDFLERHLQCFVPAASAEIMKRIDALRCLVAATAVVDREVLRVKSVTNGMSKVLDEVAQLKHEVEMNSNHVVDSIQNDISERKA